MINAAAGGGIFAAVGAAALLGFRHGVDYDHVAAIADLTGAANRPAHAIGLAVMYGLGHGAVIVVLGALSVAFGMVLPASADRIVETAVGLTLIVLGAYVLGSIATRRSGERPMTRFELIRRAGRWLRDRFGFVGESRPAIAGAPSPSAAFGVGIVHGIGAETPTQLALFVLSAGIGGWGGGLLCVATFAAGLLAMNILMAAVSAGMFHLSAVREPIYRGVMIVTGAYSVAIGAAFILSSFGLFAM